MNHSFLGAVVLVMRVFKAKTEMPIGGLNSSSSKTNHMKSIKVSNLEASGQAGSASKIKF